MNASASSGLRGCGGATSRLSSRIPLGKPPGLERGCRHRGPGAGHRVIRCPIAGQRRPLILFRSAPDEEFGAGPRGTPPRPTTRPRARRSIPEGPAATRRLRRPPQRWPPRRERAGSFPNVRTGAAGIVVCHDRYAQRLYYRHDQPAPYRCRLRGDILSSIWASDGDLGGRACRIVTRWPPQDEVVTAARDVQIFARLTHFQSIPSRRCLSPVARYALKYRLPRDVGGPTRRLPE